MNASLSTSPAAAADAPHLTAAGVSLAVVACLLLLVQLHAWQLEERYVRTLAPASAPWREKSRGIVLQRLAFSKPDLLPVYGSSELILQSTHDADAVFKDEPTGFRPFEVASPATTPILMLTRLAAVGEAINGRRLVITMTPSEFYRPQLEQPSYNANFSRVQATALTFSANLPYALRQAVARRMLQYPATIAGDPILRWGLEALANPAWTGRVAYGLVFPLGALQNAALQLSDHWQFVAYAYWHPELHRDESAVPRRINWPELEAAASRDAATHGHGNPFGFEDSYWQANSRRLQHLSNPRDLPMLMPVIPLVAEGLRRSSPGIEWQDLALLLDIVQALGGRPIVVSSPFSGAFFDYWGVTAEQRTQYYKGLQAITSPRKVPLVTFSEHDEDHDFDRDPEGHLSDKGWVQFDEIFDTWYHTPTTRQ